jgi:hypothetical protein
VKKGTVSGNPRVGTNDVNNSLQSRKYTAKMYGGAEGGADCHFDLEFVNDTLLGKGDEVEAEKTQRFCVGTRLLADCEGR